MKKILIIEDDVFLGDALSQKLKSENFEVLLVRDGLQGYAKIKIFRLIKYFWKIIKSRVGQSIRQYL